MKKSDAVKLWTEHRDRLIGKPMDNLENGWNVKDVIVASNSNAAFVYSKMWENNISNDAALAFFSIKEDEYDTFVISHQWPWGSGDILTSRVTEYLKRNPNQ